MRLMVVFCIIVRTLSTVLFSGWVTVVSRLAELLFSGCEHNMHNVSDT